MEGQENIVKFPRGTRYNDQVRAVYQMIYEAIDLAPEEIMVAEIIGILETIKLELFIGNLRDMDDDK